MGNTQSGSTLTRTTGALDSFVAELGGEILYEKRSVASCILAAIFCDACPQSGFCTILKDREMSAQ